MPKPAKIKKPKSFMFTTKHHSFSGWMGVILCVLSLAALTGGIYLAFINAGKSNIRMGSQGFFAIILNFIGLIAGITGYPERDIHKWVPILAMASNTIVMAAWVLLVIYSGGF